MKNSSDTSGNRTRDPGKIGFHYKAAAPRDKIKGTLSITIRSPSIKFKVDPKVKVKVKVTLVQVLRFCTGRTAHRWSRGIALLFHDKRH